MQKPKKAHKFSFQLLSATKKMNWTIRNENCCFYRNFSVYAVRTDESLVKLVEGGRCLKFVGNAGSVLKFSQNPWNYHQSLVQQKIQWLLLIEECSFCKEAVWNFMQISPTKKIECSWNILLNKFLHLIPPLSCDVRCFHDQLQSLGIHHEFLKF